MKAALQLGLTRRLNAETKLTVIWPKCARGRKTKMIATRLAGLTKHALTLLVLLMLLTGCASNSTQPLPSQNNTPPLSALAVMPERSPICSPSCSISQCKRVTNWQQKLIDTTSPGSAATPSTTDYCKQQGVTNEDE
ncbi:lysis accessory protein Rz1 [Klebsiella phage vB_KpnS-MUC-5]|nr:lysis accessory protein Rz1 [Klebsiella phage vB_KpnS-MUC-5]